MAYADLRGVRTGAQDAVDDPAHLHRAGVERVVRPGLDLVSPRGQVGAHRLGHAVLDSDQAVVLPVRVEPGRVALRRKPGCLDCLLRRLPELHDVEEALQDRLHDDVRSWAGDRPDVVAVARNAVAAQGDQGGRSDAGTLAGRQFVRVAGQQAALHTPMGAEDAELRG